MFWPIAVSATQLSGGVSLLDGTSSTDRSSRNQVYQANGNGTFVHWLGQSDLRYCTDLMFVADDPPTNPPPKPKPKMFDAGGDQVYPANGNGTFVHWLGQSGLSYCTDIMFVADDPPPPKPKPKMFDAGGDQVYQANGNGTFVHWLGQSDLRYYTDLMFVADDPPQPPKPKPKMFDAGEDQV